MKKYNKIFVIGSLMFFLESAAYLFNCIIPMYLQDNIHESQGTLQVKSIYGSEQISLLEEDSKKIINFTCRGPLVERKCRLTGSKFINHDGKKAKIIWFDQTVSSKRILKISVGEDTLIDSSKTIKTIQRNYEDRYLYGPLSLIFLISFIFFSMRGIKNVRNG